MNDGDFKSLLEELGYPRKEVIKNTEFLGYVSRVFKLDQYETVYDLCCGKGLVGLYLATKGIKVVAVDSKRNSDLGRSLRNLGRNYTFQERDIWEMDALQPNSFVFAIHACGTLTDRVIDLTMKSNSEFAVMSCCHDDKIYFTPGKMPLDEVISPKNRVIWGKKTRMPTPL